MGKIKLLIIEENILLREGISAIFKNQQRLEVEAISGVEDNLEKIIDQFNPHLILLNAGLQSRYRVQVEQWIGEKFPKTKLVVMSLSLSKSDIIQFMDAGVTGFILKEAPPHEYFKTITAIATDENLLPVGEPQSLLESILNHVSAKEKVDYMKSTQITDFELQLLQLISEGMTNADIGEKLAIEPESVKHYLYKVKQKLYLFSHLESSKTIPLKSQLRNGD